MSDLHRIDLPGLVGDVPLGFLAVRGLMTQVLESSYLSWDPEDRHAILYCYKQASGADLVSVLMERLGAIREGEVLPFTRGFPVRRRRGAPDPLRVTPAGYRQLARSTDGRSWLEATITDEATDPDGHCLVNPLIAVRGRQTIGSFWYYPMLEVRRDPERLLTEALTGWRGVEGSEGWLLDHNATYSTDPGLRGPGGSMAVPGATWLATLAVPEFGYPRYGGPHLPKSLPPAGSASRERRSSPGRCGRSPRTGRPPWAPCGAAAGSAATGSSRGHPAAGWRPPSARRTAFPPPTRSTTSAISASSPCAPPRGPGAAAR